MISAKNNPNTPNPFTFYQQSFYQKSFYHSDMNILDTIVARKREEIAELYQQHDLEVLRRSSRPTAKSFYATLAAARAVNEPFFICEFKRKSPSEGWINRDADLPAQVQSYVDAGAKAVSVLGDTDFFGGSYDDLRAAATVLGPTKALLLQKDFVLDPIQIYLAREAGADMILLIAAILSADELEYLRQIAEGLGMGALVEVHDAEELKKVQHLPFPVLGVNNRDLKTFRTALNRVNVLARAARGRYVIAESGIKDYRDFQLVRSADGFLIGTSLMRQDGAMTVVQQAEARPLLKACGIRTAEALREASADYLGINFSPVSKRRMPLEVLDNNTLPDHAVAVFYQNTEAEIVDILQKYPFKIVQLYADDVSPAFVRSLKKKVFLACRVAETADLERLESYAADVDLFILDGAVPGSGQRIGAAIPTDFPYPFLLAGGIHAGNTDLRLPYRNCVGIDMASGIETEGKVDLDKINVVLRSLVA